MNIVEIVLFYRSAFIQGFVVTLELAAVVWFSGLLIGGLLGFLSVRSPRNVGLPVSALSFALSGVPILVLLFWMHYPAQQLLGIVVDPFWTASAVLSIVNVFTVQQIIRSAVRSLPGEFRDAARVCGLDNRAIVTRIELPLLARHVVSPLLVSQVVMLHMTLFSSLISVEEIFRVTQRINAQIYRPIELYSALGVFFLAVSLPLNGVAMVLQKRFGRSLSER